MDNFDHSILIVDDEKQIGKALGRLIHKIGIKYVHVESGHEALDKIKTASKPFSLILSDQQMPNMLGSDLLGKVKKITPDTIRFLITGYADGDTVSTAVNKGAIHQYITKPWDNKMLIETIKTGLNQHAVLVENHKLFELAKKQNAQLYTLNTEFEKNIAAYKKIMSQQNKEIARLKSCLENRAENNNHLNKIKDFFIEKQLLDKGKLDNLYAAIIIELYEQFQDISLQNGFKMPQNIPGA